MSKLQLRRATSPASTLRAVLRDVCASLSECLKEQLHQASIRAKESAVVAIQTFVAEQETEKTGLLRAVCDVRERTQRVWKEREQALSEKDTLAREWERVRKTIDYSRQRNFNAMLEKAIVTHRQKQESLRQQVETLQDALQEKCAMLQSRENEVRMMRKELEKSALQRSLLLDRISSDKPPAKTPLKLVSKSQAKAPKADKFFQGIRKNEIKPFTSFNFSLNVFQSGPLPAPSGLDTFRSSKDSNTPSSQRKAKALQSIVE